MRGKPVLAPSGTAQGDISSEGQWAKSNASTCSPVADRTKFSTILLSKNKRLYKNEKQMVRQQCKGDNSSQQHLEESHVLTCYVSRCRQEKKTTKNEKRKK